MSRDWAAGDGGLVKGCYGKGAGIRKGHAEGGYILVLKITCELNHGICVTMWEANDGGVQGLDRHLHPN